MSRKQIAISLALIAIIALGVIGWLAYSQGSANDALPVSGSRANVTLTAADRPMGSAKAPITIVEYAAPTCPHCSHFNAEVFPLLKSKYIDTGKVYYVFRVFPLNSVDVAAEAMARCLPAGSYMQFIDLLFRNQDKWDPEFQVPDVHAGLVSMGRIAGMSAEQVDKCIANKQEAERITNVGTDAQKRYDVSATPTFIVNGQIHSGAYSWQDLQTLLDSLAKKK